MATRKKNLFSEDDIRTQVVHRWLKDCGLSVQQIVIETSIKIQLGRGIKTINSRADILVKNLQGDNLLIVEVKEPDHNLETKDYRQALSYSRSLADGGIAPFTIITNGVDTVILDSITGGEIGNVCVPKHHEYITNGFRPTGDAIKARGEALQYLITLSSDNLMTFCEAQVQYRMSLLKSRDLYSGKKYIPELYVERKDAKDHLETRLFNRDKRKQLILVIGPPQHGKTCFLCHSVEMYLAKGIPCLFYPAISMKNGLLNEIREDFEWTFLEDLSAMHIINRLNQITQTSNQKLILFIDGWNEMVSQALSLNDECLRLQQTGLQVVVSTTSSSLTRLLQDEAGNPSYIANITNLNLATIRKLSAEPLNYTKELDLVQIGGFDYIETQEGKQRYELAYNVRFLEESNLPNDPFYLRLAAEEYANDFVPNFATRTRLIHNSLIRKAARRGIGHQSLLSILNKLAEIILIQDTPFSCVHLPTELCGEEELSKWKESAILIEVGGTEIPKIDFYYTHDKDFCIAVLHRQWDHRLRAECDIVQELEYVCKYEAGRSALRWFLSCPENSDIIERIFPSFDFSEPRNHSMASILANAIVNQVNFNDAKFGWIEKYLSKLLTEKLDNELSPEVAHLIYSLLKSINKDKENTKYKFWIRWLLFYDSDIEEIGIEESLTTNFFDGKDIRSYDGYGDDIVTDFDKGLFLKLTYDNNETIAHRAGLVLSYSCPRRYLYEVPKIVYHHKNQGNLNSVDIVYQPCMLITRNLFESYYGSMCPGWLDVVEKGDEEVKNEFIEQKKLWSPILRLLDMNSKLYSRVIDILDTLAEYALADAEEIDYKSDPDQLSLF